MTTVTKSKFEAFAEGVASHWGDKMPMMAMEECGELVQAISKMEREAGSPAYLRQALVDEIGDVLISAWALAAHYGISKDEVQARVEHKMNKKYEPDISKED